MPTSAVNAFFEHPILNSPYECPSRHWELAADGQPTQKIIHSRRIADFITPIPTPKKQKNKAKQLLQLKLKDLYPLVLFFLNSLLKN